MRKQDIELAIDELKQIKAVSNKFNYTDSSNINKHLVKVLPLLEEELNRMDTDKVEVNCPQLLIIGSGEAKAEAYKLSDYINKKMQELVINGFKIIDFGIYTQIDSELIAYIKYTN